MQRNRSGRHATSTSTVQSSKYRRLARAAVGAVIAIALTVTAVTLLTPFPQNHAVALLDNCADPPPVPGPARPWEADVTVSTYSRANTRSGNLFTQIPVVSWSGKGPLEVTRRPSGDSAGKWLHLSGFGK